MKKPAKTKTKAGGGGKTIKERPQGGPGRASGINTPIQQAKIPQVQISEEYGRPTQRQKM
jgi:hypothetical protein